MERGYFCMQGEGLEYWLCVRSAELGQKGWVIVSYPCPNPEDDRFDNDFYLSVTKGMFWVLDHVTDVVSFLRGFDSEFHVLTPDVFEQYLNAQKWLYLDRMDFQDVNEHKDGDAVG